MLKQSQCFNKTATSARDCKHGGLPSRSGHRDRRQSGIPGCNARGRIQIHIADPRETSCRVICVRGQGILGDTEVESVKMVIFVEGNQIEVRVGDSFVRFMLKAGAPFWDPIVPHGPFVMNTLEETQQALTDFKNGTFLRE